MYDSFDEQDTAPRGWLSRSLPVALAGLMLSAALGFSSSMIGRNAEASNPAEAIAEAAVISPTTELLGKGSLLPENVSIASINLSSLRRQTVISDGKSDLANVAPVLAPISAPPIPKARPANIASIAAAQKAVRIIPASYQSNDAEEDTPAPAVKRMIATPAVPSGPVMLVPPVARPTAQAQLPITPKSPLQAVIQTRVKTAELTCLARAVYFESRSESDLGQLAVAKVVLNRVKNPNFPKTICGVVYQGSEHRNSCQFSFACDGLPDDVRSAESWAHAKHIAERALADDPAIRMLEAVNYHADYVTPRWSKTMKRLVRIGHHIFYSHRNAG